MTEHRIASATNYTPKKVAFMVVITHRFLHSSSTDRTGLVNHPRNYREWRHVQDAFKRIEAITTACTVALTFFWYNAAVTTQASFAALLSQYTSSVVGCFGPRHGVPSENCDANFW
jgi:hypothetical protein